MKTLSLLSLFFLFSFSACSTHEPSVEGPEKSAEKNFSKVVERHSANSFEENLIHQAEAIYPPHDSVLRASKNQFGISIPAEKAWWYSSFDQVNIPYAITNDAVDYYCDLINAWNANPAATFLITASLSYTADVHFHQAYSIGGKEFSNVYAVTMQLKWNQYCGDECAMWFTKDRIVLFDASGIVVDVFHDGISPVAVS